MPASVSTAPSKRRRPRTLAVAMLAVCGVAAGIAVVLWWQERPLTQAAALLEAGQTRQALAEVNRFLQTRPRHGRGLALKARILVASGQPDTAIDLYERVGAAEPADMHALAQALLQRERWGMALPILEILKETGFDRADVLHELAACRTKVGDIDGALAVAEEFAQVPGMEARGQLLIGTIHRDRGNLQQVAAAWGAALVAAPDAEGLQIPPVEFFLEYGRVLLSTGESQAALELIRRSVALEVRADSLVALGDAQTQLGQPAEAEEAYLHALQLQPGAQAARIGLAQLALSQRDAEKAKTWLAPFESIEQPNSTVTFLLQRTYTLLGDRTAAERWRTVTDQLREREQFTEAATQVLRDFPESNWAHVIRAHRFAGEGNWTEAERILKALESTSHKQPFIRDLLHAVETRGPLPPITDLPLNRF